MFKRKRKKENEIHILVRRAIRILEAKLLNNENDNDEIPNYAINNNNNNKQLRSNGLEEYHGESIMGKSNAHSK